MAGKPNPNSMYSRIKNLTVGETLIFPAERTKTVRTMSSELGYILERKYKTAQIENRMISVTRIN
jgi:hypothetical protein